LSRIPLTPLEIASGLVGGEHSEPLDWPERPDPTPRAALERCLLPALERPPCVVSFSGGRDSAVVLAVASAAARGAGLDPPIPSTHVFPGRPRSDEERWQRLVLDRLKLPRWERIELHDELDLLGPIAGPAIRRHGVLYPWNAYSQVPSLRVARGGTLLTGWGGDDLFTIRPVGSLLQPLRTGRRPRTGDLRRLVLWSSPRPVRRRVVERFGMRGTLGWLTPAARRAALAVWAEEYASEPRDWRRRLPWLAGRRDVALTRLSVGALAQDEGAAIAHPLWDPGFLAASARAWGPLGPASRTHAYRALAGDLLPREVIERRDKGWYGDTWIGPATRRFARAFEGAGLDRSLVDPAALRRTWSEDAGIAASAGLLQSLWLAAGERAARASG
jgi:asparagine synthase (glutamine-hydrolysing)